ncbi:MAG TPA: DUF1015 family protein [Micromonosporaceae bacterium]|jgi:uncharacterized protein (DUF1015 family)
MSSVVVHPIARAWLSGGGTGARNYDEFADDAEITQIIAENPRSALAIEMPHRVPDSTGRTFASCLPDAAARLRAQRSDGSYLPADEVLVLYRITAPGQPDRPAYGLFAMVDTDQISTSAEEPGRVIRNEDVFLEKVRERVALAEATRHLLSPVLLLQTRSGAELHERLRALVDSAGSPAVTDIDHVGREHAIWPLPAADPAAAGLAELAGRGELVVADGNHRSLAAQIGGLRRFLAVVTTPASVAIQPYHRLVTHTPVPLPAVLERLREAGATVVAAERVEIPRPGTVILAAVSASGQNHAYAVRLPTPAAAASVVDAMDHSVVERLVLAEAMGLEPGDKRIVYVGGDYPPEWLDREVADGRAELAILIAPVTVEQFVAVNLARQRMPRKSTWFTPKARGGLVLADLGAEAGTGRAPS